ncbi:hypothetical protein [Actibacterium sp. 188UL27-1]|uniref:hypothetical protein n=1 Tax=Actibacterium sp. 188UL27-1 TaxID=2786961 RepID=UPI001956E67F|nr:hypothetical protein [Actibacterium sp. 188UL27-1]MBM7070379.1 hypothetical protein [Actibacterium sp. 188UL27-1]
MRTLFAATLSVTLSSGAAAACSASDTQTAQVVEVVEFRLAEGADQDKFMDAVDTLEASFLCNAPGYVSRTLTQSENGLWLDMVYWTSLDEALAAADAIILDESAIPFMQAIDPASINMAHWSIVSHAN